MKYAKVPLCPIKMRKSKNRRNEQGSIVLEAALIMPLFLAFTITLISFVSISIKEIALQHAVSETTKQIAAHMYPVDLLLEEARSTQTGDALMEYMGNIKEAREQLIEAEQFVTNYALFIPSPLIELAEFEIGKREELEEMAEGAMDAALNAMFKPILGLFIDMNPNQQKMIDPSSLKITKVVLPNLQNKEDAFFGIEAEYKVKLAVPFFQKVVYLKKRAYERVWVGIS